MLPWCNMALKFDQRNDRALFRHEIHTMIKLLAALANARVRRDSQGRNGKPAGRHGGLFPEASRPNLLPSRSSERCRSRTAVAAPILLIQRHRSPGWPPPARRPALEWRRGCRVGTSRAPASHPARCPGARAAPQRALSRRGNRFARPARALLGSLLHVPGDVGASVLIAFPVLFFMYFVPGLGPHQLSQRLGLLLAFPQFP
jgi:hypothetical protein